MSTLATEDDIQRLTRQYANMTTDQLIRLAGGIDNALFTAIGYELHNHVQALYQLKGDHEAWKEYKHLFGLT